MWLWIFIGWLTLGVIANAIMYADRHTSENSTERKKSQLGILDCIYCCNDYDTVFSWIYCRLDLVLFMRWFSCNNGVGMVDENRIRSFYYNTSRIPYRINSHYFWVGPMEMKYIV